MSEGPASLICYFQQPPAGPQGAARRRPLSGSPVLPGSNGLGRQLVPPAMSLLLLASLQK